MTRAPSPNTGATERIILYYRVRPSDRVASAIALRQQRRTRDRLIAYGADIAGSFTEIEDAPPGDIPSRPELVKAYAAAAAIGRVDRPCTLGILRVDAIGTGEPFPVHSAAVRFLDGPYAPVSTRYLGWAAMDRQLAHEWRVATGRD